MLSYLNGTKDLGLRLEVRNDIGIDSSIDACLAVYANRRSQGGLAISLGIGVVKAQSHKLTLNTKSSAESELESTFDDVSNVIHMREFLLGQGYAVAPGLGQLSCNQYAREG